MGADRWPCRVSEHDWGARAVQGGNRKPWAKVQGAAVRYGLRDSLIAIRAGLLTLAEWSSLVDTTIQDKTREDWKTDVKLGRKLSNYVQIKEAWKFEEYLEGNYSKERYLWQDFGVVQ